MKLPAWTSTDFLAGAVVGAIAALMVAWGLWRPSPAPIEAATPAKHLPSGGQVLERAPAAPILAAVKKAAREAGGQLERAVSITVQPKQNPTPASAEPVPPTPVGAGDATPATACSCAPVTVDLGLVRMPDDTRRVVATSEHGEIVGGLDIPTLMNLKVARQLRWAAGGSYGFTTDRKRELGAFVDRDLGPLRLGIEIQQRTGSAAAVVRVGIRF